MVTPNKPERFSLSSLDYPSDLSGYSSMFGKNLRMFCELQNFKVFDLSKNSTKFLT